MFPQNTHFLIADDFVSMRKVIRKSLEELGYTNVQEAVDGKQALDLLQAAASSNNPYDFVIADLQMPHTQGQEVWNFCRQHEKLCTTNFLFLSTGLDSPSVLEGLKSKSSDFVVKPFALKTLKNKLQGIWECVQDSKKQKAS